MMDERKMTEGPGLAEQERAAAEAKAQRDAEAQTEAKARQDAEAQIAAKVQADAEREAAFQEKRALAEAYRRRKAEQEKAKAGGKAGQDGSEAEPGAEEKPVRRPELRFAVNLTAKDLWQFSMYHSNSGFMGVFNVLFTLGCLYLLVSGWGTLSIPYRVVLAAGALMFTVWQPFLLYRKARRQAKGPAVKEPMVLSFDEEGLIVEQSGQTAEFSWEQMARMDRLPKMAVLYMDRVHAYLLPVRVMGGDGEQLYELARTHLPKERRRKF